LPDTLLAVFQLLPLTGKKGPQGKQTEKKQMQTEKTGY